ncbi:hypothetical protein ACQEU8_36660 [Streptomyces sp. CA-250714]|uniref:hypothetical protein n=1 Tax=Streptomyces sp. CA-250714 TaxID=3240060 RepID=UPI003D925E95
MTALTAEERQARRDSLLVLLSRAQRGVLTPSEAGLLRAHVETELRAADRAVQRAVDAEEQLRAYRAVTAQRSEWQQRAEQAEAAVDRVRETARRHGPTLTADEIEHAIDDEPCSNPDCEHLRGWHTDSHGCISRGGACPCRGFEPPAAPCCCGEPSTPDVTHRTDGPCHVDETPESRP